MYKHEENELRFVVQYYKKGHKNSGKAWNDFARMSGRQAKTGYRRIGLVACAILGAIVAIAAIVLSVSPVARHTLWPADTTVATPKGVMLKDSTIVFRFDNVPVATALSEISRHYGAILSANDTTKRVTGEFETHNVDEAVEVMENVLGVKIIKR